MANTLSYIVCMYLLSTFVLVSSKNPIRPLEKITEFRQQHRKTLDGRLCAAAFLHDDQTYTDCTDAVSPDGSSGREWCYVEVQLLGKGSRDWDYCSNSINYNKLRIDAKKAFEEKSLEADRLKDRLNVLNGRIFNMLQKYDSICGTKHELINSRLEKIHEWLTKSEESLDKIKQHFDNIESTKKTIDQLQIDIKKETASSKQAAENCEDSPGYENEPISDGLNVSYFSNPFFEGMPIETTHAKNINFFFNNRAPIDNISPYKYGIRYDGYLLAPHSGTYIFIIETDCAVRLFLNNKLILSYGFETIEGESDNTGIDKYRAVRYSFQDGEKGSVIRKNSKPTELIGGIKHEFLLEISHSSHLKYKNGEAASFKLLWKSSRIDEQIIKNEYFFTQNVIPPTRVSALNPEFFKIGLIDLDEEVFKNDKNWAFSKVPSKYRGLHLIKTDETTQYSEFTLSINTSSNLFVGYPSNDSFPLGPHKDSLWKSFETDDVIETVYKQSKTKKQWSVKFIPLKHRGTLHFRVLNNKTPFFLFNQKRKILPAVCSGEEEVLSIPGNKVFKECKESSALTNEFNCIAGFNNLHMDKKFTTWRTANSAIGEYVELYFNNPVQINKFRFKPRDDMLTWPSEIALTFDDTEVTVPILHTSSISHNTFKLEYPVITTYAKIEIKDMFVNNDETGGSFEFLGNSCNISNMSISSTHAPIDIVEYNTTLNNIPDALPLIAGDKFVVRCSMHLLENATGNVYGSDIYAAESSICKSAIHAGACIPKNNKDCDILIIINNKRENFVGNLQNNILSSNLSKSANLSFSISSTFSPKFNQFFSTKQNSYSIVFKGINDLTIPNNFLIDSGNPFKDFGGFAYGWNKQIKLSDSTSKHTSILNTNYLFSGGIDFPPASASEHCISDPECESNYWKFRTHENGEYAIQVLVGNTHFDTTKYSFIEVNGTSLIKNVELKKHEYFVAVKNIQVTERTLLFTSTCIEQEFDCSNAQTTILAVQIVKI